MTSLVALTGNNTLVSFQSEQPNNTTSIAVTGLDGTLIGIDTRPANGMLYGITENDKIYTINVGTGAATFVSTLDRPFNATSISGFDFNPVADRLRLVGDNDQDFRINVDTGAVTVDGDLSFAAGDANAGDNPSVTAAAYTNSFAGTLSTMLYDIDEAQDILVLQDPPNDGLLKTVGELGIDFSEMGGFEIESTSAGNNAAFAVSNGTLYSIDLGSGAATSLGTIGFGSDSDSLGNGDRSFRGLSLRPDLPINPIAANSQFLALTNDDKLVSFDPSRPDVTMTIDITGIDAPLLGIDTRPSNGLVYGITTANTVYTINPNSGVATKVSTLNASFNGTNVSGFDFNPVADRLRLVGDNDQDFRINVETGEVTIDGDLAFAEGDVNEGANPRVTAVAYANSIANPSTTALYDIDTDLDILALQNPPNDGTLITRGSLGFDIDSIAGFDIVSSGEEDVGARILAGQNLEKNAAFAVAGGGLYNIDILTGQATLLSNIGDGSGDFKGLATVDSSAIVDPIARNSTFLALTDDGKIASFDPSNPEAAQEIAISGLRSADERLLGFDTRPSNGLVYGITNADNIYTIDPTSGRATFVSTLDRPFNAEQISGFDFNPVADRLRLVGDNDQDFRINVETGGVTVDGNLAYATGDVNQGANPKVTAAAYTNAIANPTATQLYDIDTDTDTLVLQNPPNDGTLMTIGELGVDFGEQGGFDIVSSQQDSNSAFAVSNGTLYSIDLLTGEASSLGPIGSGTANYVGFTTISRGDNGGNQAPVFVQAGGDGIATAVVYDLTGASRGNAVLGIDPASASSAGFDNFVGLYEVVDTAGGVDVDDDGVADFNPGDDGYAAAAIGQRVSNFEIRTGGNDSDNTSQAGFGTVSLDGGAFYAPFLIANIGGATPEDFLTNNPNNDAAAQRGDSVAYFSFIEANPDGIGHLKSYGMGTFGFEDLPGNLGGSDNDFNDAVFQVDITLL